MITEYTNTNTNTNKYAQTNTNNKQICRVRALLLTRKKL